MNVLQNSQYGRTGAVGYAKLLNFAQKSWYGSGSSYLNIFLNLIQYTVKVRANKRVGPGSKSVVAGPVIN